MSVGVEGESVGEVAQHPRHRLDVYSVLQRQCCEGVAVYGSKAMTSRKPGGMRLPYKGLLLAKP